MAEYNGWKNYQTWNVHLWLTNSEGLYHSAVDYAKRNKRPTWKGVCKYLGLDGDRTPDNVAWTGTRLDYAALNAAIVELKND